MGLILRRLGLGRLSALDPKVLVVRCTRAAPGEMTTRTSRTRAGLEGHRITGDQGAGRSGKVARDFRHVPCR